MAVEARVQPHVDRLVDQLKAQGAIRSEAVEGAMRAVPRHRLLEAFYLPGPAYDELRRLPAEPSEEELAIVYSDQPLVTRKGGFDMPSSSTSQPDLVARMLEALDLHPGLRVLEIGAGTGYNAALMAEILQDQGCVTTLDIQDDVVEQTRRLLAHAGYGGIAVLARDGFHGCAERAPFDRIVATVGCSDLSPHWLEQLAPDGFALIPLRLAGTYPLLCVWADARGRFAGWAGFMPIFGELSVDLRSLPGQVERREGDPPPTLHPAPDGFVPDEHANAFWYFLGLRDRRTSHGYLDDDVGGFGLFDDARSWAIIGESGIHAFGENPPLDTLIELHKEWVALGRPQPWDFALEFVPLGQARAPAPDEWSVDRGLFRQHVRLSPGEPVPDRCSTRA